MSDYLTVWIDVDNTFRQDIDLGLANGRIESLNLLTTITDLDQA